MDSLTDCSLMLKVRDGDLERMSLIFDRYSATLFNYFLRLTGSRESSEDLVQEVFFRLLKYRKTFRGGGFTTWLFRIARNTHIDLLRKRRPEVQWEDEAHEDAIEAGGAAADPESETQLRQERDMLLKALERLPVEKRDLLLLSRMQGLKHTEIAEVLGCPVNTVRVRVHRALLDLRAAFTAVSREGAR